MKKQKKPELFNLGVSSTEKSVSHENAVDATIYDSQGNYWESRS